MVKPPYRGKKIGNWEIDKHVGGGGQGTVWQARPLSTGNAPPRAIKICVATDPQARERFRREVAFLKAHEARAEVVSVLDQDLTWEAQLNGEAAAYFVMELAEGTIDDPRWLGDTLQVLTFFKAACEAVDGLNESGLLHRDLKPANILVYRELPHVRLCDFGVAVEQAAQGELTRIHEVVGSVDYRAPEVQRGHHATRQSEVFSLGRVLQHLLCGTFDGIEIAASRHVGPRARKDLEEIIRRSTDPNPGKRYVTVGELARALPTLEVELPVSSIRVAAPAVQQPSEADVRGLVPIGLAGEVGQIDNEWVRRRKLVMKVEWKPLSPIVSMLHVAPLRRRTLTPLDAKRLLENATVIGLAPLGTSAQSFGTFLGRSFRGVVETGRVDAPVLETTCLTGLAIEPHSCALVGLDGGVGWRDRDGVLLLDADAVHARLSVAVRKFAHVLSTLCSDWFPLVCTIGLIGTRDSRLELKHARAPSAATDIDVIAHAFLTADGNVHSWFEGLGAFLERVAAMYGEDWRPGTDGG